MIWSWSWIGKGYKGCTFCGNEEESTLCLFRDFHFRRPIAFASRWGLRLDKICCNNMEKLVKWCLNPPRDFPKRNMKLCMFLLVSMFYITWNVRNEKIFEGKKSVRPSAV